MFGGSFNDPFFSSPMGNMPGMMQDPFAMNGMPGMVMFGAPQAPITDGRERHRDMIQRPNHRPQQQMVQHNPMDPFGTSSLLNNMFSNMNSMMGNMQQQMVQNMQQVPNNPNGGQFYSSSTVMSFSNGGDGAPRVYQASSSTRQGPGGVRETHKTERDSHTKVQKMAIGRYLGERGHVQERMQNGRTGEHEENHEYLNLDEEEGNEFDSEWTRKAGKVPTQNHPARIASAPGHSQAPRAIMDSNTRYDHTHRERPYPNQSERRDRHSRPDNYRDRE